MIDKNKTILGDIITTANAIHAKAKKYNNLYLVVNNQTAISLEVLSLIQDKKETSYSGSTLYLSFAEWKQYLFNHKEDFNKLEEIKVSVEWLTGKSIKCKNKFFKSKEQELRALYFALRLLDKSYNDLISEDVKNIICHSVVTNSNLYPVAIGYNIERKIPSVKINYEVTEC